MSDYPTSAGYPPSTPPLMIDRRDAEIERLQKVCDLHWRTISDADARAAKTEAALSEREKELQQLRGRHSTTHVPTLERIKRAHTAMPLSQWAADETAQHRTYYQGDNEQCYLCALVIQLEAAEKIASEREKELAHKNKVFGEMCRAYEEVAEALAERDQQLLKYGQHLTDCQRGSDFTRKCTCYFSDAIDSAMWPALSPSQESSEAT